MKKLVDGMAAVLQAYLDAMDTGAAVALIAVDFAEGDVQQLGEFETLDEALRAALNDYREYAKLCTEDGGDPPENVLRQAQFIAGRGRVERVITWREAVCDDLTAYPVMVVSDPMVGELAAVTVESCPDDESDDEKEAE